MKPPASRRDFLEQLGAGGALALGSALASPARATAAAVDARVDRDFVIIGRTVAEDPDAVSIPTSSRQRRSRFATRCSAS